MYQLTCSLRFFEFSFSAFFVVLVVVALNERFFTIIRREKQRLSCEHTKCVCIRTLGKGFFYDAVFFFLYLCTFSSNSNGAAVTPKRFKMLIACVRVRACKYNFIFYASVKLTNKTGYVYVFG